MSISKIHCTMEINSLSLITIFAIIISITGISSTNDKTKSTSRSYTPFLPQVEYQPQNYYQGLQYPVAFNYRATNSISTCAQNTTLTYCVMDMQYPLYEISEAYQKYRGQIKELVDGSFTVDTEKSVDTLNQISQEKFLCPATVQYAKLLRAMDINGRWRIILNVESFSQTVRLETCTTAGQACPNLASCFSSSCLQKYVFQRLIVYNEIYDHYYNPFTVATFKLPSSCCCRTG